MRETSLQIKQMDEQLRVQEEELAANLAGTSNIPHASVPVGSSEADNPVLALGGADEIFGFEPCPHWEIGEALDILDFARGAKLSVLGLRSIKGWAPVWKELCQLHARSAHWNRWCQEILPRSW